MPILLDKEDVRTPEVGASSLRGPSNRLALRDELPLRGCNTAGEFLLCLDHISPKAIRQGLLFKHRFCPTRPHCRPPDSRSSISASPIGDGHFL